MKFLDIPEVKVFGVVVLFPLEMAAIGYLGNGDHAAVGLGMFALILSPLFLMAIMGKDL